MKLICIGCRKIPAQLDEYWPINTGEDMTPDAYVWAEEGTLNTSNGHFTCTACYVKMGMPTLPGTGWKAP